MSYTTEKLEYLKATKLAIKNAIISKGQNVTDSDTFRSYADKITAIEGSSADIRYVTFMSYDGSIEYGRLPVAVGYDCPNPKFDTPTRESTAQYSYTFAGWSTEVNGGLDSNALKAVEEDRTVYANFAAIVRKYTISFYDGDTLLTTKTVAYGSVPSYTPKKDGYDFVSWEPELAAVTGEASYYAQWKAKAAFGTASWAEIAEIVNSGAVADFFALGDTRTVPFTYEDGTTEDVTFEIVDMDSSNIISGTTIAIMATHALKNPVEFNAKLSSDLFYMFSSMLSYMKDTLTPCLPEDMQAVIQNVSMPFSNGNSKMHIPTSEQICGYGYKHNISQVANQNNMLEAFINGKSKICKTADGTAVEWWTASTANPTSAVKLSPTYFDASGKLNAITSYGGVKKYVRPICFI